jgi:hypothetical protein
MRLIILLTVVLGSMAVPVLAVGEAAADDCSHHSSASTGTGPGLLYVNVTESSAHPCTTSVATQGPELVINDHPACGLGGDVTCQALLPCGDGGALHDTDLVFPDGHTEPGPQVCVGGEQAPAHQLTAERVLRAFREVPLPTPSLGTSPPDGTTLVNVPTIFYTRAEPFGRDVRVLGRRVHLEIAPVSYQWRVGQGGDFETTSPGSPYQRGVTPQSNPDAYVTWTYDSASSEAASVRVVWGATWSLGGKSMGRVPGTVEMLSSKATVRVREAQPVLTASTLRD